jgi:hypothetical protein
VSDTGEPSAAHASAPTPTRREIRATLLASLVAVLEADDLSSLHRPDGTPIDPRHVARVKAVAGELADEFERRAARLRK